MAGQHSTDIAIIGAGPVGLFAVFEAVIFILILAGGLIYAWRKGALEWV